jgi:uncharacterized protein YbcI
MVVRARRLAGPPLEGPQRSPSPSPIRVDNGSRLRPGLHRTDVTTQSGSGEILAEISKALVALYKEAYGRGPTKARTYISGDLVVCLLEGGFVRAEQTLRDAGRGDAVSDQREALQEVLRKRFVGIIEELTGRKVSTFISGVDLEAEMNAEVFVLEPVDLDTGDEREAVSAWADQTLRQARVLRSEQAALRDEQAGLRQEGSRARSRRSEPESAD